MTQPLTTRKLLGSLLLLLLVGLNLRLSLAGFTPLVPFIQEELSLSSSTLGLATGAAVIMFGVMAPVTPVLVTRFGPDHVLAAGLVTICAGTGMRFVWTFAGMVLIGAGIGLMNVVLPAIIKRDHPHRMAVATAVYTSALNVGSAAAASSAVPLAEGLGSWRGAALITGLPALVALVVWVGYHGRGRGPAAPRPMTLGGRLWRSALAWQVTAFMALQSVLYYVVLAWLPTIYTDAGMTAAGAGAVLAVAQVGQLIGCIATPILLRGRSDLRAVSSGFALLTLVAFLGFVTAPTVAPFSFGIILGVGQGGALVCALLLIGLRSPDARTASSLSGMSQSVGYILAAAGPPLAGLLFDVSGSWTTPLLIMCALCVVEVGVGSAAGRDRALAPVADDATATRGRDPHLEAST
ncbi:MFS transporter [Georgenia sp. H159]|uniref:MFS transporter n=1 Tax=Georgenia sp. H159 TaxID=3076115 RepID=UPI002D76ED46|nr:MFS transporter [Georgenia sp. H159]